MFPYCEREDLASSSFTYSCNASSFAIFLNAALLLLAFLWTTIKSWQKYKEMQTKFWPTLWKALQAPTYGTFCEYFSDSIDKSTIFYYSLMFICLFSANSTRMINFVLALDKIDGTFTVMDYLLQMLGNFTQAFSLFVYFLSLEIVALRCYYVRINERNLVSSAVSLSERKLLTQLIIRKAFILAMILALGAVGLQLADLEEFRMSNVDEPKFYIYRLFEYSVLIVFTVPKLALFRFEKNQTARNKRVFLQTHMVGLIQKHLRDLKLSTESINEILEDLIASKLECLQCKPSSSTSAEYSSISTSPSCCLHTLRTIIDKKLSISFEIFKDSYEIATNSTKSEMLSTNPRNNIGILKAALLIMFVEFIMMACIYGLSISQMLTEEENFLKGDLIFIRTWARAINTFILQIFVLIILNTNVAFGSFHAVLEQADFELAVRNKK